MHHRISHHRISPVLLRKPIALAGLVGLAAVLWAGPARAWTCNARCAWYQPDCLAQVATCAAASEACRTAALGASAEVHLANDPGQALTDYQKHRLRPFFGDLVDRVSVHYEALLAGEMYVTGQKLSWGYVGQTFGHDIFLAAPLDEARDGQLVTLAHELTHSWQYERDEAAGGDFYRGYCRGWVEAGFSYEGNVYEREATWYTGELAPHLTQPAAPTF
jgi:hypothetical protein